VSPYVSIVLTGRNDEHGSDFRGRFLRALAFNTQEFRARNISAEVVLVEWAPIAGREYLIDIARREVPAAAGCLRGYVVDSQYQAALTQNPNVVFLEFVAKNVGIRRARGRFVLSTNCDVLLGRHVLDVLQREALLPRSVHRALRLDLTTESVENRILTWELLEDPRNLEEPPRPLVPPYLAGGTGDFVLVDRETFDELRGFNQVYRVARIGVDTNFLIHAASNGIPIVDIGGPIYHVNHAGSYRLNRNAYLGREADAPWGDVRWHSRRIVYANPDNWGLGNAPESALNGLTHRLEFSWDAVSPLVDLHRVMAPAAPHRAASRAADVPQSPDA
jgi:hypothetical protein